MANEQNLRPVRTKKEARERGSKGGKASVKARREKKAMQELAQIVLNMPIKQGEVEDTEYLHDVYQTDKKGNPIIGENGKPVPKNLTVQQMSLIAQAQKAIKGDAQALAFLRDTAGEKPVERVEVNADISKATEEIEDLIGEFADG